MSADDVQKLESYLRRTANALIKAEEELAAERDARTEPIAVVSMACRLPGGIASPEEFWELLAEGGDAVEGFPARWDALDLIDADPDASGKSYAREGGFLSDVDKFDAGFFGISPREAQSMDPQQRIALETTWEALERAGITPESLRDSRTGVYLGSMGSDYENQRGHRLDDLDGYVSTGNASSVVSGRVSYTLGLRGPAVTVDTACSSSLVALHLANAALRRDECELAIVGGVMVMSTPAPFVEFSRLKGMAADGRCKSFSASADGTGWSEGCALIVLKRLSHARRDGDRVLAVLRGSAINQDGRSQGLTAPNGPAQQGVIHDALAACDLTPADIDAIEAHGTGTTLGDPIEAGALAEVFGPGRERPLWLGSAKSNIGHTQAAAGVTGVIKMILALRHESLPKSLYAENPSQHVDWASSGLSLLADAQPWPRGDRPRRAGVSSFGFSGTNAHVIVEEPPPATEMPAPGTAACWPLLVSGRDEQALRAQSARWAEWLAATEVSLAEVARTAATQRSHFAHRACVVGATRAELVDGLQALADGQPHEAVGAGVAPEESGGLAMLFTGQGAQRVGMGRGLAFPVFRAALDEVCAAIDVHLGRSLAEVMDSEEVHRTEFTQPALFAFEVALFELWKSWGVAPSVVAGHSIGELAAAFVAGVMSLEDAARLVVARGRLMQACRADGAMVSIEASASEITLTEGVSIAGLNSPNQTVISGDEAAVLAVAEAFKAQGRRVRRLGVSHAFHSGHMDGMLAEYAEVVATCEFHAPRISVVSTVTGEPVTDFSGDYWVRQVRDTVRFTDTVAALDASGVTHYLECGPSGTLSAMAAACVGEDSTATFVPSVRADDVRDPFAALGALHTSGRVIDWAAVLPAATPVPEQAPTYAFQRDRFWLEITRSGGDLGSVGLDVLPHPWLGAVTSTADGHLFTGRVSLAEHPWLADHTVFGRPVVPGTALLELALAVAERVDAAGVAELTHDQPLVLPVTGHVRVQVTVTDGTLAIHSRREDEPSWTCHATGTLLHEPANAGFAAWTDHTEPVALNGFYDSLRDRGMAYGETFRTLTALTRGGHATVRGTDLAAGYGIHPALLDAALHPIALLFQQTSGQHVLLPVEWRGVERYGPAGDELRVRVELVSTVDPVARLWLTTPGGTPVAYVHELRLREVTVDQVRASEPVDHLYRVDLHPVEAVQGEPAARHLVRVPATGDPTTVTTENLALLKELLAADSIADAELVWVLEPGLATAPLAGLLRTASTEHPGRVRLVTGDGPLDDALATGEPELVLRDGKAFAPRLARVDARTRTVPPAFDPAGVVLLTGGVGELGRLVAGHLVAEYGVRRLVLTSRRGPATPGTAGIVRELTEAGATVEVVACDVTDRDQLAGVIAGIDRLTGVCHLAGVLDDGLLTGQDAERFERVLAPKLAAWHLHELTTDHDLAAFVLFSSISGVLGSAGQANYAAANTYLDALAEHRRAEGLPAVSLAWGLWEQLGDGMTAHLGQAELSRLRRQGIGALTAAQGLKAFDAALAQPDARLVPARFELAALGRELERGGELPAMLRGLVRAPRKATAGTSPKEQLAALSADERLAWLTRLVCREAAVVLGAADLGDTQVLAEVGMDSLMAVELRKRLAVEAGVALPATLAFDYPTPAAIAGVVLDRMALGAAKPKPAVTRTATPADDPIAIVSMACRLPGGVTSPEEFWELLGAGGDAISGFPERWRAMDLYDPDPDAVGKSYAREGGFLADAERFDAAFFGISPREAQGMDPQQRIVLETVWEALERAGIRPDSLQESNTGVYLGAMSSDYDGQGGGLADLDGYVSTGNASSVVSGRVSYALGLQGPALTVDTACSSSLVALHLASAALRSGETDLAIVGGVAVMSTPTAFVEFSRLKGLAADGRCKSFSASADGVGWAEGCGIVILKRLSHAERDGDRVLALVTGSSVNQDGRSQGLTAPNGPSQQRVIQDAVASAGLTPADIDAVEAHGTGTSLGDPIEAGALAEVFGPGRETPLWLGSSKSNIGHTQAAAGVAGIIKMVLALGHESLPRSLYAENPSPHITWAGSGLSLLADAQPWPRGNRPRRAGVSSFGFGGTNAHVVIEEPPATTEPAVAGDGSGVPVLVSGRDQAAVRAQAARWADRLADLQLPSVARTAALHRTHFDHRASVLARDTAEAVAGLRAIADGGSHPAVTSGVATRRGKVVFVFPGQGSQWVGMGWALLEQSPEFAATVAECDREFEGRIGWSVTALLRGDLDLPLDRIDVAQPALFTMYVSLAAAWRALGLTPDAVVGHSQGEVAAAVVAGALTIAEGAHIIATRSRALHEQGRGGEMAVVELPFDELTAALAPYGDRLSVAAINTARSAVISGDVDAVNELLLDLDDADVVCGKLNADCASHSAHMDPLLPALAEAFAELRPAATTIPFYSAVTAEITDGADLGARYWCRNLREPVRLDRTQARLMADGHDVFVEVSPHPVLALPLNDNGAEHGALVVDSLQRDQGDLTRLRRTLGVLHVNGHDVDWAPVLPPAGLADLPTYAFQREHYWLAPATSGDLGSVGLDALPHPWLGAATVLADGDGCVLTGRLSLSEQPWLADHAVFGTVVVPGTGLLELALYAAQRAGAAGVEELTLSQPLVLPATGHVRLQVAVGAPESDGRRSITVHSQRMAADTDAWTLHATGVLVEEGQARQRVPAELTQWPPTGDQVALDTFYPDLLARGIGYGPAFQGLESLWRGDGVACGLARLPENAGAGFDLHPALLDAALHTLVGLRDGDAVLLPFEWAGVELFATASTALRVRVTLDEAGQTAELWAADTSGNPVAHVRELRLREVTVDQIRASEPVDHLYRVDFQVVPITETTPSPVVNVRTVSDVEGLTDAAPRLVVDLAADDPETTTLAAFGVLRAILADSRLDDTEVVFVTRGAVAAGPDEDVPALAAAPLWGLLRAARAEHPDRVLRIVDVDTDDVPDRVLAVHGEPELVVRDNEIRAARLVRVAGEPGSTVALDGTALVTGGVGELGRQVALHLVREHGVRSLVLISRRGADTPGGPDLVAELTAAGATDVRLVACDVTDRARVAEVLAGIDRLTAVLHLAGLLDDGVLTGLGDERVARVLAPKITGARHLHELTEGLDLAAFVLFSSASGVLGTAGQTNYAAANTYLDALAAHRRADGLVATSLSWGLWEQTGEGLTAGLGQAELARIRRAGVGALSNAQAMRLLDAALTRREPHLVPVRLELAALRREVDKGGEPPALLRGLVRTLRKRAATDDTAPAALADRLAALPEAERRTTVVRLVCREVATVLGVASGDGIDERQVLRELGLDSLMAVELRRRLVAETGTTLPATLAFDYPTPAAIAGLLLEKLAIGGAPGAARAANNPDAVLDWVLEHVTASEIHGSGLLERLVDLVRRGIAGTEPTRDTGAPVEPRLEERSVDDINAELDALLESASGDSL